MPIVTDPRAREVDFGAWEGLSAQEALERDGDLIRRWDSGDVPAPGGESLFDVVERMATFVRELAAEHAAACSAAMRRSTAFSLSADCVKSSTARSHLIVITLPPNPARTPLRSRRASTVVPV